MTISSETKIGTLLDAYPALTDFLVSKWPVFSKLKNPILRNTVARVANLSAAASIAGIKPEELVAAVQDFLKDKGLSAETPALSKEERQAVMKDIIKKLHAGGDFNELKSRFAGLVQGLEHSEIAAMEQALMKEGLPAEEITRLCDVHAAMFQDLMAKKDPPKVPKGHPLYWHMEENRALEKLLGDAESRLSAALLDEISKVHIHYARKENQLFPLLEKHGIDAPSKVMWAVDDEIRALVKSLKADLPGLEKTAAGNRFTELAKKLRDMVSKEEQILFPLCVDTLTREEWQKMKLGDAEIGFAWIKADVRPETVARPSGPEGLIPLNTGSLSPETVDLILNHLPLDLSFIDESDKVRYYTKGRGERIFPRSPEVIGRDVRNCHPPKSLKVVEKILADFKAGSRDVSEFWITLNGRFLHIRYFAVRDGRGKYLGTLEMTQDVTAIRALEGERRLLDWN